MAGAEFLRLMEECGIRTDATKAISKAGHSGSYAVKGKKTFKQWSWG